MKHTGFVEITSGGINAWSENSETSAYWIIVTNFSENCSGAGYGYGAERMLLILLSTRWVL
jgi:hypothetical protein